MNSSGTTNSDCISFDLRGQNATVGFLACSIHRSQPVFCVQKGVICLTAFKIASVENQLFCMACLEPLISLRNQ